MNEEMQHNSHDCYNHLGPVRAVVHRPVGKVQVYLFATCEKCSASYKALDYDRSEYTQMYGCQAYDARWKKL